MKYLIHITSILFLVHTTVTISALPQFFSAFKNTTNYFIKTAVATQLKQPSVRKITYPELRYDWDQENWNTTPESIAEQLPDNFQFGSADSALQVEGKALVNGQQITAQDSHWIAWQESNKEDGTPRYTPEQQVNEGCERITRYKEDFALVEQNGFNSYRFCIPWSKVESQPGVFNQEMMEHYKNVVKDLKSRKIEPWICLYHHDHPTWFENLNAFEKKENIKYFVNFADYVQQNL